MCWRRWADHPSATAQRSETFRNKLIICINQLNHDFYPGEFDKWHGWVGLCKWFVSECFWMFLNVSERWILSISCIFVSALVVCRQAIRRSAAVNLGRRSVSRRSMSVPSGHIGAVGRWMKSTQVNCFLFDLIYLKRSWNTFVWSWPWIFSDLGRDMFGHWQQLVTSPNNAFDTALINDTHLHARFLHPINCWFCDRSQPSCFSLFEALNLNHQPRSGLSFI